MRGKTTGMGIYISDRATGKCPSSKVTFGLKEVGRSHVRFCGKSSPGKGHSKCTGPEAGWPWHVACYKGTTVGVKVRKVSKGLCSWGHGCNRHRVGFSMSLRLGSLKH